MRQTADSATTANQLANSAADVAQRGGINQVNATVTQLDQMARQNAALAAVVTAAAESLREQSGRLADAVGVFRLR